MGQLKRSTKDQEFNERVNRAVEDTLAYAIDKAGLEGVLVVGFRRLPDMPSVFYGSTGNALDDSAIGLHGIRQELEGITEALRKRTGEHTAQYVRGGALEGDQLEDAVRRADN